MYDELLARTDYYEDSRARRGTLVDYVESAGRLYGEIPKAGDAQGKLSLLKQIEIFWPEYRDIQERIQRLEHTLGS